MLRRRPPPVSPPDTLRDAFWLVLGREPSEREREWGAAMLTAGETSLIANLLASPEFALMVTGWRDDVGVGKDPTVHEAGLRAVGSHDHFVRHAYKWLLGRDADPGGLAHYVAALEAGEARRQVLRTLVLSDEFESRYRPIAAREGGGVVPRDIQLCELANPAKWDNPDWLKLLKSLEVVPHHKQAMHRKSYEWTQLLFGLTRLGKLGDGSSVLSVGAGHECVLYWLANHAGHVVATDLYEGRWQSDGAREGDAAVVEDPAAFAPFAYRRDRLTFLRMDGRHLSFENGSFDVVYSLSSIEHFGGYDGARASLLEMARVLKPGGVLAVATEYIVSGPDHHEAFQPSVIRQLFDLPGLRLVAPLDEQVYRRYDVAVVDLRRNLDQRPHMLVSIDGTVFTSVMLFLEKTSTSDVTPEAGSALAPQPVLGGG